MFESAIFLLKYGCNHDCNFCLNTWKANGKVDKELNFEEKKMVLEKVKSLGVKIIVFSGGEPTLDNNFLKLVEYANFLGFKVGIQSNGTLWKEETVFSLKDKVDWVQISLEGLGDVHDNIVGVKSFKKVVKTMKMIKKYGGRLFSNITVTKSNISQFSDYLDFVNEMVDGISVTKLYPSGKGLINYSRLKLSEEEWYNVLKIVEMKKYRKKVMIKGDTGLKSLNSSGCVAGNEEFTINPNGDISLCPSWPKFLGNILKDDLEGIWKNDYLNSVREVSSCGKCVLVKACETIETGKEV
jgi:AdoMet-dependent heme synthase